jgi:hypothetical protein
MATSQNGWTVITSEQVAPLEVRGVAYVPGVRRSLLPLFTDLCERLADIEAPMSPGCWGWNSRPIRGQTSGYSNHASGTAVDHNAPRHPRGSVQHAGYSADQVTAIHELLKRYDGVIRWGGDYRRVPFDPMHFEVVGTAEQVSRVIERLRAKEGLNVAEVKDILDKLERVETKVETVQNTVKEKTGKLAERLDRLATELAEVKALVQIQPGQQ